MSAAPILPTFGANFLDNHAGNIIRDPHYAIIELIANSWDAGADEVRIQLPQRTGEMFSIADNGTGMTLEEFRGRWTQLNYNRLEHQGSDVQFPPSVRTRSRTAFGRNGIGRHAMFCFADEYRVETAKDGLQSIIIVKRSLDRHTPFSIYIEAEGVPVTHTGTTLSTQLHRNFIPRNKAIELIGSRFVADPEFKIYIDGELIQLTDLSGVCHQTELQVEGVGDVLVRRYDSPIFGRTSQQNGVAWWVNYRAVGAVSWNVDGEPLTDARTGAGRRYTYVVEADLLVDSVKADWSGFHASSRVNAVRRKVAEFVRDDLRNLTRDIRTDRKKRVLQANKRSLIDLSRLSQEHVAHFAEEILLQSPSITEKDLENAVQVLSKLEKARSGYALLDKLATLTSAELDQLDAILDEWSVIDIKKILEELQYRLKLITKLEELVDKESTDELHDLQPLFERGLWIFGPEFESIHFTSNRTLATVAKQLFGSAVIEHPRLRPDFVVLPDSSIGFYAADAFDDRHEVSGFATVIIVELKRGGFTVSLKEKDQATNYARLIRQKTGRATKIIGFVLGSTVDQSIEDTLDEGNTHISLRPYTSVLRAAHARTFKLLDKIQSSKAVRYSDKELEEVISRTQLELDLNAYDGV